MLDGDTVNAEVTIEVAPGITIVYVIKASSVMVGVD
jgi:molybdopterin-binding protein